MYCERLFVRPPDLGFKVGESFLDISSPSTQSFCLLFAAGETISFWNALVKPLKDALQEPCTLRPGLRPSGAAIASFELYFKLTGLIPPQALEQCC